MSDGKELHTWHESRWHEWVYADATGKILGGTSRSSRHYHAYLTGEPSGKSLGEYLTENQAKAAVERALATLLSPPAEVRKPNDE